MALSDEEFWRLIEGLGGRADDESVARLERRLRKLHPDDVRDFHRHLVRRMNAIATEDHRRQEVRDSTDDPAAPTIELIGDSFE